MRPHRSRLSAAPTGARARPIISPISPSAMAFRSPPPSAARMRSQTAVRSMPASLATGPIPSCSSACAMPDRLAEIPIICNGAGNFSGSWHRYWRYGPTPTQLAPASGTMGYGLPAAVAAALRFKDRPVVAIAGDGDFLMNGQELATAAQYGADLLVIVVDNSSYGTIRMHQEREYPERISATELNNPDFAALGRGYGGCAETVEATEQFAPALDEAVKRKGLRLIHCKTDVEQISNATTIARLRAKKKK